MRGYRNLFQFVDDTLAREQLAWLEGVLNRCKAAIVFGGGDTYGLSALPLMQGRGKQRAGPHHRPYPAGHVWGLLGPGQQGVRAAAGAVREQPGGPVVWAPAFGLLPAFT